MGRPKKDGDRYPSGDLVPGNDGPAPALMGRLTDVARLCGDPRLATQLSRLGLLGVLTNRQVQAGLRLGEIVNKWRRLERMVRSTPKSASLEGGFSGGAEVAEERMTAEQLAALQDTAIRAREEYDRVMEEIPVYPREVHQALLELCVEDQPISSRLYPEVKTQLNRLSAAFDDKRKRKPSRGGVRPLRTVTEKPVDKPVAAFRPPDVALRAVELIAHELRPDMDADGIKRVKDAFAAYVAREKFRGQKARGL